MGEREDGWPQTWDEWSLRDRDRRERAALDLVIRGRWAQVGRSHEIATRTYRAARRSATIVTLALALPLTVAWALIIRVRNASIAQGLGDRSFAPAGFALLILTVVLVGVTLWMWNRVLKVRPGPLVFESHPDSADTPRHPTFDGTSEPPRRW